MPTLRDQFAMSAMHALIRNYATVRTFDAAEVTSNAYRIAYSERRLAQHPYPRHPADANPVSQNCAEIELAQVQAKALLKHYTVTLK